MFKLLVDYPSITQEREILTRKLDVNVVQKVITKNDIFKAQKLIAEVYSDNKINDYIVNLVFATRSPELFNLSAIKSFIQCGVSPRATLALYHASKARAFLRKRHFVTPDDVKAVAPAILRHRISLTYEAQAEDITTDQIIHTILNTVPSP